MKPPATPQPATPPPPVRDAGGGAPLVSRLPNGLGLYVSQAGPGDQAQLQLAFLVGSSFVAAGLAELAAAAVVQGADASRGRPSLEQAIAALGGTVQVVVGPLTTWIDLRVPLGRWQDAHAALLRAVDAPPLARGQLERIRDGAVATLCAAVQADPVQAMATALLLAESDTTAHATALLDRDASEIALFQTRLLRPERALLVLQVPGDPAATAKALAERPAGTLAAWNPPASNAPDPRLLTRSFQPGLYWSPDPDRKTCSVAWLQFLPSLERLDAADLYMLHSCVTLDGAGGRLERLQRERGLGHLRWRTEFLRGADTFALLLRTEASPGEVPQLRQVLQAARRSLRDVPPNASELELASRRAALTAGLGLLDGLSRQRVLARLAVQGGSASVFDRRLARLAAGGAVEPGSAAAYLDLPAMLIAIGGEIPADVPEVRRFTLLPPGLGEAPAGEPSAATSDAAPWLERASEAVGGSALLRRLVGSRCDSRLQGAQAPPAVDAVTWRSDGTLLRKRQVLGKEIVTRLEGTSWSEAFDAVTVSLTADEAGALRREFERHPLALLAATARGDLAFQAVAQRSLGDRTYMVLQARGNRFDRLRIHIDTVSHLVRIVEVWEQAADGATVHLQDAWSDYRGAGGLRAPFRRVTTQDDGQNVIETTFVSWQPLLSPP
ncbi:MAG: hypothetical protein KF830_06560 [Planctomycetes bacterium]|nr:hypothetical protein [Planctomycetota bacterium]